MILLHPTARTTYKIRQEIKENQNALSTAKQAALYNISKKTVLKWRNREVFEDAPHGAREPKKSITDLEEYIICELRKTALLPLDDLLDVVHGLGIAVSRSALDRALRRNGLSNLKNYIKSLNNEDDKQKHPHGEFKEYNIGFIHIDIKYLPKIDNVRNYLYVAIDRASRLVFASVYPNKTALSAKSFLEAALDFFPFTVTKVLTDNGKEFTDGFHRGRKESSGNHPFDQVCAKHTKVQESVLDKVLYTSAIELNKGVMAYISLYNRVIKHSGLGREAPVSSLCKRFKSDPELFKRDFIVIDGERVYLRESCEGDYRRGLDR